MRYSDDYNMSGMKVTKKKLLRRLEYLCKFFKEQYCTSTSNVPLGSLNINQVYNNHDPTVAAPK